MTEKRFKIVDEQFISYYGGTGHKISNGECGFWLWHDKTESQKVCDKLNSILDENEQLKKEIISLKVELDTHKHPLWSTREAERIVNELKQENEQLKHELLCKQLDKAPTKPINCKCYYKECDFE